MSGEQESTTEKVLTAKERLDSRDALLKQFEDDSKLPPIAPPGTESELQEYLLMSKPEMEILNSDECAQIATRLSQYSFYIQRLINHQVARRDYAESEIRKNFLKEAEQYGNTWTPFKEKLELAVMDSSFGQKLRGIQVYAQQRISRLEYLAISTNTLAERFLALHRSKIDYGNK